MEKPVKLLLVEDNKNDQQIVVGILKLINCDPDIVDNGVKAVDAVINTSYEIVLMDLHMPEMDGFEATRQIRALPTPKGEIPIVALTADTDVESREKALSAGMNDFIIKPIKWDKLLITISRFTSSPIPDIRSTSRPETE